METLPARREVQIESLISQALDKNVPVETLERLLAMANQLKAEYAREAFDTDMSNFQADCPIIVKTKPVKNNEGRTAYKYAPIDAIISQVKELLRQYSFSYMMKTEMLPEGVVATCIVKHKLGHTQETHQPLPFITQTKMMSESQKVEGTFTIAKRLAFCNAFGILTGELDTNGVSNNRTLITQEHIEEILELLRATGYEESTMLERLKVSSIQELTEQQAITIIINLKKIMEANI